MPKVLPYPVMSFQLPVVYNERHSKCVACLRCMHLPAALSSPSAFELDFFRTPPHRTLFCSIMSSAAAPVTPPHDVADSMETLAATLTDAAKDVRSGGTLASPEKRRRLVDTLKGVLGMVHSPQEDLMNILSGFCQIAVVRFFIKWKVFENIPSDGTIPYKELAVAVGADTSLIGEIPFHPKHPVRESIAGNCGLPKKMYIQFVSVGSWLRQES